MTDVRRREFITVLGGVAAAWPLAAHAQQPAMPVVGFINAASARGSSDDAAAFGQGLKETGYAEGQNVVIEYHWLEGRYDDLPTVLAGLVRRQVSVIATPGGNATGVNFFLNEAVAKRFGLLHDLVPGAVRLAVMVNPGNVASAEATLREVRKAAVALGVEIRVLNASTSREIDAAFASMAREHIEALFVAPDGFFTSRRVQFAILAARNGIAAAYSNRTTVEAGGLMSYGTNIADMHRQVGVYVGRILKGANPADLPVVQPTKFEFVINLQTARALSLEVPSSLLLAADEVIE